MSDWTQQDVNSLLPGEPWTAAKAIAAFENVEAAFEGAEDAPKLQLAFTLDDLVAGDVIRWREDADKSVSPVTAFGLGFLQQGTVRFRFEHRHTGGTSNVVLSRWRNGVTSAISTFANTTSFVERTVDVTVVRGDYYLLTNTPDAGNQAVLRNCRISTTGMRIWPFPQFAWEA